MSDRDQVMLAIFLSIDPEVIRRDLRVASGRLRDIVAEITALRETDVTKRTPEQRARIAHLSMVHAHELARMEVESEFKVFYANFGAGEIVQTVEVVSFNKGKLAQLGAEMAAIRRREGLADGEFWLRCDGPADHRALEAESEQIAGEIADMILAHVLRRYDLADYADLYEKDRRRFELMREIAGRILMGDAETAELMDRYMAEEYGPDAVAQIRTRVAELRARLRRPAGS